jgi:hypothetical protein
MPELNVVELDQLEAWIDAQHQLPREDREWNQRFWRLTGDYLVAGFGVNCGTTFCAAGRVAAWHGAVWHQTPDECGGYVQFDPAIDAETDRDAWDERLVSTSRRAQTILGLSTTQAEILFELSMTYDAVKNAIAGIRSGDIT